MAQAQSSDNAFTQMSFFGDGRTPSAARLLEDSTVTANVERTVNYFQRSDSKVKQGATLSSAGGKGVENRLVDAPGVDHTNIDEATAPAAVNELVEALD